MDWQKRISINPKVMGGKPVIAGTRVPLEVIVGALAAGEEISYVCDQFAITEDDVRAALAYATEVLADERVYALPS
jgi:uncharacterized protein (DUF433 family)